MYARPGRGVVHECTARKTRYAFAGTGRETQETDYGKSSIRGVVGGVSTHGLSKGRDNEVYGPIHATAGFSENA